MELQKVAEITVSYKPNNKHKPVITTSKDAYDVFQGFFSGDTISLQEQVVAMYLNRCNRVIGVYKVCTGGIVSTIVDIKLILSVGIKTAASFIVLGHNHPSGNLKPSKIDEELTAKLKTAANYMEIKLLDHIILVDEGYYSFADEGMM